MKGVLMLLRFIVDAVDGVLKGFVKTQKFTEDLRKIFL